MNQQEALATIIDFVREQAPEDRYVLRALKYLEKKHAKLAEKREFRFTDPPEDLMSEPLAIPYEEILTSLHGTVCRNCGGKKAALESFCRRCYSRLDLPMRKAVWQTCKIPYIHAFCRAVRLLKSEKLD